MRFILLLVACVAGVWLAPLGLGQEPDVFEKLQAYLERNPYHERSFERLTHVAQEQGRQQELLLELRARLADAPEQVATRVLLARMEAHLGDPAGALARLDGLEALEPGLWRLRGELRLRLGDYVEACAALEQAAEGFLDRRLAGDAWVELGRARLRLGERDKAVAAFEAFAELEPDSFGQRFEAAALLEEVGLEGPALSALERALELAADDAAARVRVLAMRGTVLEGFGRAAQAEEAYGDAMELLGPGHWQREELFERRLHLRRSLDKLPEWISSMRKQVALRSDGQLRGFLARALFEYGDRAGALEVLEAGARSFPEDLQRGLDYAEALADGERVGDAVAEFQRLAALHPRELGLHREAGALLAGMGAMETAQKHWALELERAPKSIALHLELARMQAQLGAGVEQERLLQAAWFLDAGDLRALRALLDLRRQAGRKSALARLLSEAQYRAEELGDAIALEDLAQEWEDIDQGTGALRCLELALEAGGNEFRLLGQLANSYEYFGEPRKALAAWRRRFALTEQSRERVDMALAIGRLRQVTQTSQLLQRELKRELLIEGRSASERLLLACALGQTKPSGDWRSVLADGREDLDLDRETLLAQARLAEGGGQALLAAVSLEQIMANQPAERVRLLPQVARLYRLGGRPGKARSAEEKLLALAPSRPSLILELAEAELRKKNFEGALEYYEQVLLEKPGDARLLMTLLEVEQRAGRELEAGPRLASVLRCDDAQLRAEAREWASDVWRRRGKLKPLREKLREQRRVDSRDCDTGLLLAMLQRLMGEPLAASRVLEQTLKRFPREAALLELRDELRGLVPGGALAPWGPKALTADESLARNLLRRGQIQEARAVLERIQRPSRVADIALEAGVPVEALRVLRRLEQKEKRVRPELLLRLAFAYMAAGQESRGMRYAERAARALRSPWELSLWIAERYAETGRSGSLRSIGEVLLAKLFSVSNKRNGAWVVSVARIGELFERVGQRRVFESRLEQRVFGRVVEQKLFEVLLASLSESQPARVPILIYKARKRGDISAWLLDEWSARYAPGD